MVFHAQGSDIVIFNIRTNDDVQQEAINLQTLTIDGNDVHVWTVSCILNNQLEPDIHVDDLGLYRDYHNINNFLDGDIVQVPNAENVHNTLNQVMNNDWQDVVQHGSLFQEISRVLMPLRNAINVNSSDKFRSILHGVFYVCDNPDKVITGYAVGQTYSSDIRIEEGRMAEVRTGVTEQRLGLLLLRSTRNHPEDTHPIGYVLKFVNDDEEVEQEQNEAEQQTTRLMDKERGYWPITSGNEIVLSYAVFNAVAQRVEDLISVPQELYIHRFDRSHASGRTRGLVGPDSVIDENPPENLLSDITRKRLAGYFQDNQKQTSIPLFDLGNNRWVAVRYLEGSKERVIRRLTGTGKTPTEQEILQRIRAHRPDLPEGTQVHDLLTLEFATNNQFCRYWLQQHDIVDIARSWYDIDVSSDVVRELSTISAPLQEFRNRNSNARNGEKRLLTLIINLNNNHWIALVIAYQNGGYVGYYANSSGGSVPDNITDIIKNVLGNNVAINNVSIAQQRDSHNCGLWALENARDINQVLQQEHGGNVLNEIRNSLTLNVPGLNNIVDQGNIRNEQYFQNLRRSISEALEKDQLRQDNQAVTIAREYQDNMEIRELLLQFLELQYPQREGGGTLQLGGERVISIDFGPQSALDEIDGMSRVYDCSKCKSGR